MQCTVAVFPPFAQTKPLMHLQLTSSEATRTNIPSHAKDPREMPMSALPLLNKIILYYNWTELSFTF